MISFLPVKQRNSIIMIQHLFKQIKNDDRYLSNEMMDLLLKYYYHYMCFNDKTGFTLSNIKFIYFVIQREYLNYEVFFNLTIKDIQIMIKFNLEYKIKIQKPINLIDNAYYLLTLA